MKEMNKTIKKFLVILVLFVLLQSYFFFLDEITTCAYATAQDLFDQFVEQPDEEEKQENVVEDANLLDTETVQEEKEEVSDTEEQVNENETGEKVEETQENVTEDVISDDSTKENEKVEETEEKTEEPEEKTEEPDAENIVSSVEVLDSYRTLNGAVINVKITTETKNVRDNIESQLVKINAPIVEGYEVKNFYLEYVELNNQDFAYTDVSEGNNIVLEIAETEEVLDSFIDYDLVENPSETEEVNEEVIEAEILPNFVREYEVTYILEGNGSGNNLHFDILETLNYEENSVDMTSNCDVEISIPERVLNEYKVSAENASIYKGYLYASAISTLKYETKYTSVNNININSINNIHNILVTEKTDVIRTKDGKEIDISEYTRYNKTSISVEEFNNVFGEDGYIEIYSEGASIGFIDSNNIIENDKYIFEYPENINNVEFSFYNMKNTGRVEITNNKVIVGDVPFTRAQVVNFSKIETNVVVQEFSKVMNDTINLFEINDKLEINLEDTESKMDLLISTDTLSTSADNEVIFTATLRTDSERYELFRNPVIEIDLPSDIESVDINTVNLLYKNGLAIDKYEVIEGEFGEKMLRVVLTGTQEEYTPLLPSSGTTVTINTTIKLNRLTTNKESKIKFRYKNEVTSKLAYEVEGLNCVEIPVNFVSKYGLLRALNLNNLKTAESIISYDTESTEMELEVNTENQVINYKGTIVNNFETTLNDVQIIGRVPREGVQDGNGTTLETTFNMSLDSVVTISGLVADVYYSEDLYAGKDSSTWTTDTTDLSKYRSFKIVLQNEEMKQGESLEFTLNLRAPDGLDYNQVTYVTYTAYYERDGQEVFGISTNKLYTEVKDTTMDEFSEEEKQEIQSMTVAVEVEQCGDRLTSEDPVFEREILEYKIYVQNNSKTAINNVNIKADPQNANLYYKYFYTEDDYYSIEQTYYEYKEDTDNSKQYEEFLIESLEPGEVKIFSLQAIADEITDIENKDVYANIEILADDIEKVQIETIKNKIKNTKVSLKVEWAYRKIVDYKDAFSNDLLKYRLDVKNISKDVLKNQKVNFIVPNIIEDNIYQISGVENCEIKKTELGENKRIEITIPEIAAGEELQFYISLKAKKIDVSIEKVDVEFYAYTDVDGEQIKSNKYSETIYQSDAKVDYTFTCDKDEDTVLKDGDIVIYTAKIKNTGVVDIDALGFKDVMPCGLLIESAKIKTLKEEITLETNDDFVSVGELELLIGEEITLEIKAKVVEKDLLYDQMSVENSILIKGGKYFDDFYTNVIELKVQNSKITVDESEDNVDDFEDDRPPEDDLLPEEPEQDELESEEPKPEEPKPEEPKPEEPKPEEPKPEEPKPEEPKPEEPKTEEPEQDELEPEEQKPEEPKKETYRISGKAWLDQNKDGMYSNNEKLLTGIKVSLYKTNVDGKIVDKTILNTVNVENNGKYQLVDVETGKYILVFEYDDNMYSPTKYQTKGCSSTQNSDAITKVMDGVDKKVAMTDIIEITNSSINNIDIGLILNNEFDMELNKFIKKAIIKNSKGTKEVEFTKDSVVKLEINSKLFEESSVDIVYNFEVKNEGDVTGFVSKIVDYVPEGLIFNKEQNKNWYQTEDGKLYYTELAEKEIQPGQSKTIELVLHYKTNQVSSSTIKNMAEIVEASNEKGLYDRDSVPNNKIDSEDDFGKVELLITVSTGRLINNLFVSICVIAIISAFTIMLLKIYKKLTNKVYK